MIGDECMIMENECMGGGDMVMRGGISPEPSLLVHFSIIRLVGRECL